MTIITKKFISRIVFCVFIIFFIIAQILIYKFRIAITNNNEIGKKIMQTQTNGKIEEKSKVIEKDIWQLQISKIELKANICEGTDEENLNKYIGHFEETQKEEGNIGLAAHNRGYENNYFERLKELREGDEIIYRHNELERKYEVIKNKIIKDTELEVLENTSENRLTLITCVENEPYYRRCVIAEEKI